jgi:hypothetical protein
MGVTKQAVSKAVKEGRIQLLLDHKDGKMKLNPDLAAKQWRENSMPRIENSKMANAFKSTSTPKNENEDPGSSTVDDNADLTEAKTETEKYKAKLLELEFKEKTGELISAEKAKREYFKIARILRDGILNVPSQICNELAVDTDPFIIHQKLTLALTKSLQSIVETAIDIKSFEEENNEDN